MHRHRFYGDETERYRWQNPEAILVDVGLKSGLTFIDVGCGEGFFAIPAARIVGERGRVYALDFDDSAIAELKERARKEGLGNLVAKVGGAEETVFCEACADMVFFGIVLHDFYAAPKVLANAKRMLKSSGRLVDLDWKKESMDFGPPPEIRFSEERASRLIEKAGFEIEQVKEAGAYHYLVIASPKTS